jgi:thioredoxin-related protein
MKIYVFIAIMLSSILGYSQDNKINWLSFEEVQEAMKENPKPIFVDVYTDWCGWCKKLDKSTFIDSAVVKLMNTHFYAVKFDAEGEKPILFNNRVYENEGNGRRPKHDLAKKLLGNKMSFPSLVFLNQDYKTLTVVGGYMEAKEFSYVLEFLGEKKYLTQTYEAFIESKKN